MSRFARVFEGLYESWRQDITLFVREGFNTEPTWQQQELLDVVQLETDLPIEQRKKRIALASGQGPGKTKSTGWVAVWRVLRYPESICIVTSPSMRQCKQWIDELKRSMKKAHPLLKKLIVCFDTLIRINGNKIWGIKTATATRPENLQGIHEEHLTFIADEASGVSRKIMETIKGTLSNPDALFIQIGNPNTTDCDFYESFTTFRDQWHCLRWNAEDTARDYPKIVSPSRNKALADEYGIDSDVYRIRVKGEFPNQNPNSVMGIDDLVYCTRTSLPGCAAIENILSIHRAFGLDFARYGTDESVCVRRVGLAVVTFQTFTKTDPNEVVDFAFAQQHDANWKDKDCWYIADAGGMGQGVMNSFWRAGKNILEFHTQGRPVDGTMFADAMTEAWWNLRGLVREHICRLPKDPRLLKQLSTRQYYTDRKGKLKLESKDEWRERMEIDESPDRADAVVMAFYSQANVEAKVSRRTSDPEEVVGSRIRRR